VQRLVHVADEVRQEHQALRQVIWVAHTGMNVHISLPVSTVQLTG
jgi:hypothetical protein